MVETSRPQAKENPATWPLFLRPCAKWVWLDYLSAVFKTTGQPIKRETDDVPTTAS